MPEKTKRVVEIALNSMYRIIIITSRAKGRIIDNFLRIKPELFLHYVKNTKDIKIENILDVHFGFEYINEADYKYLKSQESLKHTLDNYTKDYNIIIE